MTEQPANIAREARGIHQSLKELLKNREPFDKEVDFQRKNLRRRYLSLLLVHPSAKESKDVENHLWMQTSYAFIASYKQRILNLDRIIQSKLRQQQQPAQRPNNVPIVEHRKMLQRFRQFLADEEKFWSQVVVRLRRSFALDEAAPALVALGIVSETEEEVVVGSDGGGVPPNGRNHFQFPPEEALTPFRPTTAEEKAMRLAILSKALVCLGDIARYRELYNEAGGRPKAGQEDTGFSRRSRNRRGGQSSEEPAPRPRNYEKAEQCYQQARLLVPGDGNPSHQLAIIATYRKDSFTSLTHYYRALCVRTPYDTASENLGSVLGKALEAWKTRSRRERDRQDALPPRVQVETFRENIVVLHSLWKVGMEKGLKKMDSLSRRHNKVVHDAFTTLLSQRYLPTDMISNSVVLSQGALWKHRMVRTPPNMAHNRRPEISPPPEGTSVIIEWHILEHLLDLHRGLLEVGAEELRVPPPRDAPGDDLAQRITATFRRSLPALRIASKWLKANFKYLTLDHEFAAHQQSKRLEGVEVVRDPKYQFSRTSRRTVEFWESYTRFASDLSRTFNVYKIPPLTAPLEEDIEMRGFLPLKNMMDKVNPDVEGRSTSGVLAQEAHPNDWQLMRIADLIEDAKEIAKLQNSPIIVLAVNHYTFNHELVEPREVGRIDATEGALPTGQDHLLASIRDMRQSRLNQDDDNMTEITSRTDDDVLRDAFQFLHASPDQGDDEGDEIVWDPRGPASPDVHSGVPSPTTHATPVTHPKPLKSPVKHSPTHSKAMSPFLAPAATATAAPMTAQDLLNDVLSGRATQSHLESSAPQPALLFGADISHRQGHNIWSTAHNNALHEENSRKFNRQPNQTYQAKQTLVPSPLDAAQTIWSSGYPVGSNSMGAQHQAIGTLQSPYSHQTITHGTHQRVASLSSTSMGPSSPYAAQQYNPHDPFSYSTHATRQSILRPDALGLHNPGNPQVPLNSESGMYYQSAPAPAPVPGAGYHSHNRSLQDPRLAQQQFAQPPSQLWSNVG